MAMTLQYDDAPERVIAKVNAALKSRGLEFRWDGRESDGLATYDLVETEHNRGTGC